MEIGIFDYVYFIGIVTFHYFNKSYMGAHGAEHGGGHAPKKSSGGGGGGG